MLKKFIYMFLFFSILGCNIKTANSVSLDENKLELKASNNNRFLGKWVFNTYIGDKIFKDQFELKNINNKLEGTLSVPDVFSSELENIVVSGDSLNFSIMVDEGNKPYKVKYQCHIHVSGLQLIGFATNDSDKSLIGGFVGTKTKEEK